MAIIFINRGTSLFKCKSGFSKIWYDVKKLRFTSLSSEIDERESEVQNCEVQRKAKIQESKVTATGSNGVEMIIGSGRLAKLADGSATITLNDTTVMATVVSKTKTTTSGFVPLTVVYQQKAAALGRIPLNFLRRELGQNENEILISRVIDRSVRPLFPQKFGWETQIICSPLAIDGNNFPDILSINAASAALAISDIPWNGPIGAVRLGLIDGNVIINPDKKQLNESILNLIVVSRSNNYVVMLEGSCANVLLQDFIKALKIGVKECQIIIKAIEELRKLCGKSKREFTAPEYNSTVYETIKSLSVDSLKQIFQDYTHDKISRDVAVAELQNSVLEKLKEKLEDTKIENPNEIFSQICKNVFRDLIFEKNIRCDGRSLEMLRNIECEVNLYKPLHGSAMFQRGHTQVLCTVALDSPNSALKLDRISMLTSGLKEKNFFVHYEFPPFATKDVGRVGPLGRREIGHGSLAEKALKSNIPENFPFTIRLTSEVLESNGSSSMATVCGGTLALLDAGVPIKNSCAGVAMGIVTRWSDENPMELEDYRILTDLLGIEDYYGDMDFKVAGTKKHITAVQLDVKTCGLPFTVVVQSLSQSKTAIFTILKEMYTVCGSPRTVKKSNWPVMEKITIPIHLRSKFIGPCGINVKKLEMNAGVEIVEESPGEFHIFAANKVAMEEATEVIRELVESSKEPTLEFGGVYTATIVEIREHGCMVTLYPNMQPVMIHISQLDQRKVSHPSALNMEVGQEIQVKYFGRDPVSGMMRLSRKVLQSTASEVVQRFFKKDTQQPGELKAQEGEEK